MLEWLTTRYEQLESWWRSQVVDYSFQDQLQLARSLIRPPRGAPTDDGTTAEASGPPPLAWFAAAAIGVAVFGVLRLLARRRSGPRHPASGFLEQLERELQRAGIARLEGEAIEELSSRLSSSQHPLAPAVGQATRAYLFARFGGKPVQPGERALLLSAIRAP